MPAISLRICRLPEETGAEIKVIENDRYGALSIEALKKSITDYVKLIALTHVPTNGGIVNPAEEVGKIWLREAGILYLLDACRSMGQMPMDVQRIGCHMLSATGRKFLRGPRGTGFLYVSNDIVTDVEPTLLDLHSAEWVEKNKYEIRKDALRFETWEGNYRGQNKAWNSYRLRPEFGYQRHVAGICLLAEELRLRLTQLTGVTVHDLGREKCGIVTFTVDEKSPWK